MPFYNCHIHIFSAQCAPERFLQIGLPKNIRPLAGRIKWFLETSFGHWLASKAASINSKKSWLQNVSRYGSFASVGTLANQGLVFENIIKFYPPNTRFVVLTLNMDYMGAGDSELKFFGQIDEIIKLRRQYPDTCLPFLSLDPRMGSDQYLLSLVKQYIGADEDTEGSTGKPFVGVKMYPALGYFPYDKRLALVYKHCEKHGIPIMTHCTRSGSYFLGKLTAGMGAPETIGNMPPYTFGTSGNDVETDVFLKPSAWTNVLNNYPLLKICFAHMGGWQEMFPNEARQKELEQAGEQSWYQQVLQLMQRYPNIYTDVSYVLARGKEDKYKTWNEILRVLQDQTIYSYANDDETIKIQWMLRDRILFGTDYFMTEQEDSEQYLATKLPDWLLSNGNNAEYLQLVENNPKLYLKSLFYAP